jgi:CheY-like chemotaxis protein
MKRLALVVLALVGCDPRGPAPRSFDEFVIVGECANGDAAIDAVAALRPDIVFLDVQMPGADGFDVLAALDDQVDAVEMPLIIFVTAFDEYATHAFEVAALGYLRKASVPKASWRGGLAGRRAARAARLGACRRPRPEPTGS